MLRRRVRMLRRRVGCLDGGFGCLDGGLGCLSIHGGLGSLHGGLGSLHGGLGSLRPHTWSHFLGQRGGSLQGRPDPSAEAWAHACSGAQPSLAPSARAEPVRRSKWQGAPPKASSACLGSHRWRKLAATCLDPALCSPSPGRHGHCEPVGLAFGLTPPTSGSIDSCSLFTKKPRFRFLFRAMVGPSDWQWLIQEPRCLPRVPVRSARWGRFVCSCFVFVEIGRRAHCLSMLTLQK